MLNVLKNGYAGNRTPKLLGSSVVKTFLSTSKVYSENYLKEKCRICALPKKLVIQQNTNKFTRTISTLQDESVRIKGCLTVPKDESNNFMAVFPDIVRDVIEEANKNNSSDASNWFARALQHNVPHGKKIRGIFTVLTYKSLVKSKDITEENLKQIQILGWCLEMLQGTFIINDDIMDNSSTRRGQLCWHKFDDVGLIAINDALMIESAIYILLKKYFGNLDCYIELLQLFHEITFVTTCGQSLDLLTARKSVISFNMDKFTTIAANKTTYYTFYSPIALAMILAGIKDSKAFRRSKAILLDMGYLYQVQDDMLDCFGNPDITGKIGTDIQDNKCTWLAVACMQRANKEQKQIMLDCYGENDPEKVARVKELYRTLELPNIYAILEETSYNMINTNIQQMLPGVPQEILLMILNKLYQRDS